MSASSHDETPGARNTEQTQRVPPAMQRAEVLVDQLGAQLGHWTGVLGDQLQRFWARAREDGEDIWAEANDIRERNQVGVPPEDRVEHAEAPKSVTSRPRTPRTSRSRKSAAASTHPAESEASPSDS